MPYKTIYYMYIMGEYMDIQHIRFRTVIASVIY
jgi:hypothetical protein